jgi:glycosyltransferase involved in cell wall biosynthesis
MVLIEVASLSEIPAISTNCPTGPSELLDEKYLSDIDDVDKLSKNMIRMIEDSSY